MQKEKKMAVVRKIRRTASSSEITLREAFEEFIAEKEAKNLAASTLRNYTQSFEYFIEFCELSVDDAVSQVQQSNFYKWINSMKLEGVKPVSINHYLRDCRAFFYWCMDDYRKYLPSFKIEMIIGQEEKVKTYEDEEIRALLEKPDIKRSPFTEWRTWAIVSWILATGNRAATVCEVQIGDINFKTHEITLRHTKSRKAQILPLSSSLATILKEYIRIWRKDAPADGWLFPNVGENKLTTNALRHAYARYCEDRGVERTNIHGLRHTFAKNWIINDGNIFKLQNILGHSTIEMTRRYVKLCTEDLKEDYESHSTLDIVKQSSSRTQKIKRSI